MSGTQGLTTSTSPCKRTSRFQRENRLGLCSRRTSLIFRTTLNSRNRQATRRWVTSQPRMAIAPLDSARSAARPSMATVSFSSDCTCTSELFSTARYWERLAPKSLPSPAVILAMKNRTKRAALRVVCCIGLACALNCAGILQANDISEENNLRATGPPSWSPRLLGEPFVPDPIFVYNNWSAYDELSDNVPLTEQLAMKELDEILRLRHFGVRFDYYMMDAF